MKEDSKSGKSQEVPKSRFDNFFDKNGLWITFISVALIVIYSLYSISPDAKDSLGFVEEPMDIGSEPGLFVPDPKPKEKIAVIRITGVIEGSLMVDSVAAKLKAVAGDPEFKAIILAVKSPGGGVIESDALWNEVMKVKASSKPIVAFFDGMAASGAYYLSAPADKIIISAPSITGSIGVIFQSPNFSGLMDKLGLKMITIKSAKNKDLLSPYRPVRPEEEAILQSIIDESYDQFVTIVSQGRKMNKEKVRQLADGRIYSAKQALNNGLVDEIGYFEDAVKLARKLCNAPNAAPMEIREAAGFGQYVLSQKMDKDLILEKLFLQSGFYYLDPQLFLIYLNNK